MPLKFWQLKQEGPGTQEGSSDYLVLDTDPRNTRLASVHLPDEVIQAAHPGTTFEEIADSSKYAVTPIDNAEMVRYLNLLRIGIIMPELPRRPPAEQSGRRPGHERLPQ
jgi:hypothetical protein